MSAAKRTRVACETSKDILMHAARETVVRSSVREGVKAIGTHHGASCGLRAPFAPR